MRRKIIATKVISGTDVNHALNHLGEGWEPFAPATYTYTPSTSHGISDSRITITMVKYGEECQCSST